MVDTPNPADFQVFGVTEVVAILALVLSAGSLFIQFRNWVTSKPRILLSVIPNAEMMQDDGKGPKIALTVYNRGSSPTMISHMIFHQYKNWFDRLRGKPDFSALVPNPATSVLPYKLDPNDYWLGWAHHDDDLRKRIASGKLYIGVHASHTNKRILTRVKPPKEFDVPTAKVGKAD